MKAPGTMKVFVGAGEASGDRIAAAVLDRLKARYGALTLCGFGGPLCAAHGLRSPYALRDLAVNGLGDVLRRALFLTRARATLRRALAAARPDLVLLVDYPGMNVPLARRARALGLPVYYIAPPQLWAYRNPARRLARLRRALDGVPLQVLFPFEIPCYPAWRAPITQGHFFPLPAFEPARGLRLLLCPGSRRGVLRRNLPLWLARVHAFFGTLDGVDILVPEGLAGEARALAAAATRTRPAPDAGAGDPADGPRVLTDRDEAFARAGAALAFPGTVTLELFLARIPTRVWCVVDALTLRAGRRLLKGPHVALPNLIAGEPLLPEWIGTARDFRARPPSWPDTRADWSPAATAEAVHAVWTAMGAGDGTEDTGGAGADTAAHACDALMRVRRGARMGASGSASG